MALTSRKKNRKPKVRDDEGVMTTQNILMGLALVMGFIAIAVVIAFITVFVKSAAGDKPMSAADQEQAMAMITKYSEEVEAGKPSRIRTEYIAVVLFSTGDGVLTDNEYKDIEALYQQIQK